jgi:hypothetical protein
MPLVGKKSADKAVATAACHLSPGNVIAVAAWAT